MVQVIWFKRDLRIADHAPLAAACAAGPVVPLLIVEPDLWQQPDMAGRHYAFFSECVDSLRDDLGRLGLPLIIRTGNATEILNRLHRTIGITALHSHMETGTLWTFARDKDVLRWTRNADVPWNEYRQFGVIRPDNNRDRWAARWEALMTTRQASIPVSPTGVGNMDPGRLPTADELGIAPDPCPLRQTGGRVDAIALLDSFLSKRGKAYHKEMSSPVTAATACSRLSPHLAFGTLSMREVTQAAYAKRVAMADLPPQQRDMDLRAVDAFIARLHWHCHFIQKLEDEPTIERHSFHPAFEDARTSDSTDSEIRLEAWTTGRTGWPFVDACMRSLHASGWINFRMRAMLMAVASYHLWLDWRKTGTVLARLFTDYEPGIHWSQTQMQSGTTAINTLRIYNPVKQGTDQDPEGHFVRRWIPELAKVPTSHIHEPWTMSPMMQAELGVTIGETYPLPVVDHLEAARIARARIADIRKTAGFRDGQLRVLAKHGSRKGQGAGRRAFPKQDRMLKPDRASAQLKLEF